MRSPIARGLRAASRLAEKWHRRIHGPKFAQGDVVEVPVGSVTTRCTVEERRVEEGVTYWWCASGMRRLIREDEVIRVVRYGEGE